VITAEPISVAMPMPMMVTTGTAAFCSACLKRIRHGATPLARAVRM
jgi:hypothetical protein